MYLSVSIDLRKIGPGLIVTSQDLLKESHQVDRL